MNNWKRCVAAFVLFGGGAYASRTLELKNEYSFVFGAGVGAVWVIFLLFSDIGKPGETK